MLDTSKTRAILAKIEALGLTDRFAPQVADDLARAEELSAATQQPDRSFAQARAEIVAGLADGSLEVDQAREQLIAARNATDPDGLVKAALAEASKAAGNRAGRVLLRDGEAVVTNILAPEGARCVEATLKAAEAIPAEVATAEQAVKAGGKVAAAWKALIEANDRWNALVDLVTALRINEALAGSPSDGFLNYRNPDLARPGTEALSLLRSINNGAEPRLANAAEADAEWKAHTDRLDAEAEAAAAAAYKRQHHGWSPSPDQRDKAIAEMVAEVEAREQRETERETEREKADA
ncbi:hypothetical protein [Nocardioides sp. KR10-350]|uniref:hypothetical protein n=1 Tax=Nocardioides cheoyonin TaxID=3156615 RepID=UPI0032B43BE2